MSEHQTEKAQKRCLIHGTLCGPDCQGRDYPTATEKDGTVHFPACHLVDPRKSLNTCTACGGSTLLDPPCRPALDVPLLPAQPEAETCPYDGQTLAWHLAAEPGPDGQSRTNAAFLGCAWPAELDGLVLPSEQQAPR